MTCILPRGTILTYSVTDNINSLEDLKGYRPIEGSIFNEDLTKSGAIIEYELLKDLTVLNVPNYQFAREIFKFVKMMKSTYTDEELYTQYINRGIRESDDLSFKNKSRFSYLDRTIYLNNEDLQFLSHPKKITLEN
jgi:hypothetical protein